MNKKHYEKGFSITELILIVVLMTLIGTSITYQVHHSLDVARQQQTMINIAEWKTALGSYFLDYGFYPYDPIGIDKKVEPGVFVYDILVNDKYLRKPVYRDGWSNNLRYTMQGSSPETAISYTIASWGKGNGPDINGPKYFNCFQCDIRLSNGQFFSRPFGYQTDNPIGCSTSTPCIMTNSKSTYRIEQPIHK